MKLQGRVDVGPAFSLHPKMTSLKSRLTLDLLNKRSQRKGLSKGFTLVELMIVIVIVGVLSAVALPSFLGQQNKAKITEATSKMGAILKSTHAEYIYDNLDASAFTGASTASTDASTGGKFDYAADGTTATEATEADATDANNTIFYIKATPKAESAGGDKALVDAQTAAGSGSGIYGCVNLDTGKVAVGRDFRADRATAEAADANCNS